MLTNITCDHPEKKLKVLWERTLTVDGLIHIKPQAVCTECSSILPQNEQPAIGLINSLPERTWYGTAAQRELSRKFNFEKSSSPARV